MPAWNAWYFVTTNTYATWLPGDPRSWRTRHARPQPLADEPVSAHTDRLHAHAAQSLKRPPVRLDHKARAIALQHFLYAFAFHNIEVIACAVDDHHALALARFPDHNPRKWIGIAKKESARALSRAELVPPGGVWAARSHCKPITDRKHQLDAYNYIADHATRHAATWLIHRDATPPHP